MTLSRIRPVLIALIVLAVGGAVASYAATPGPIILGTATSPINVKAGDYNLIAQAIDVPPGGVVPKHSHPGPVVVQVVTGAVTVTDGTGAKTFKAGSMFTENPGVVHSAANSGSVTARLAVSYLIPKGMEAIVWAK